MKICIAQIQSLKGNIQKNIQNHLEIIQHAITLNGEMVIFPELSVTGYEPELAKALALEVNNPIFDPFQQLADDHDIVIGVGMPTIAPNGIHISMLIFQAKKDRSIYAKRILHQDELPYFVSGDHPPSLDLKGEKIAIGICYETLQREHFINAVQNEVTVFIASVAKPERGLEKAYVHFPSMAKEFEIPILMSNSIGYCDNFLSNGQSAVWNDKGELLSQLDQERPGLLIYDTQTNQVDNFYVDRKIRSSVHKL
ncbi:carbon-nitrogen hydrolase family protein [Aquimarina spongiae]|uniref:Predicted amidohydrolase n=1 Tax=Aquimarina spongiae TaxID=570521 RepID=A0A1M6I3R3_9FLAO|nr:carbon-nitrogen hydrolase family protein [Aquimarina spongiae]SHJ28974.1 Predicted amidohydrolase [Aquimarina spongiae]